jgi:membrane dipeptidase
MPVALTSILDCRSRTGPAEASLQARARNIAQRQLLIDTHIDAPSALLNYPRDLSERQLVGHFDYSRAVEGGLKLAFMVAFVPQEETDPRGLAERQVRMVEDWVRAAPEEFVLVRSANEASKLPSGSRVGLALGLENGAAIGSDIGSLTGLAELGVRYITLTHTEHNQIGDSSGETDSRWGGLSPFGRLVVLEMQRLGLMIDVSHVSDSTFYQVLDLVDVPVIASHSGCRCLTPGHMRNMSDDMLRAIAANRGVVQVAFGSYFLKNEYRELEDAYWTEYEKYLSDQNVKDFSPPAQAYLSGVQMTSRVGTVVDVADHIDHAVRIAGIDHVGFGSDFDGVIATPTDVPDVSAYPAVIAELLRRGYSETDIKKILGENFLRVWLTVENYALNRTQQDAPADAAESRR